MYHIHGYLGVDWERRYDPERAGKIKLITNEGDYMELFYSNPEFATYITDKFFKPYHLLFIGCSMADKNLLRYLYHTKPDKPSDAVNKTAQPERFAILKRGEYSVSGQAKSADLAREILLERYCVKVIWIDDYKQIHKVLKNIYLSSDDNETWNYGFRRAGRKRK